METSETFRDLPFLVSVFGGVEEGSIDIRFCSGIGPPFIGGGIGSGLSDKVIFMFLAVVG